MKPQSDLTGLAVDEVGMRLLRAAEIIRERGWCQHAIECGRAVCAVGAIKAAANENMDSFTSGAIHACNRVRAYLGIRGANGVDDWNDAPGRTADEVIDALTRAALSHAAQG